MLFGGASLLKSPPPCSAKSFFTAEVVCEIVFSLFNAGSSAPAEFFPSPAIDDRFGGEAADFIIPIRQSVSTPKGSIMIFPGPAPGTWRGVNVGPGTWRGENTRRVGLNAPTNP